ncbi:MAG: hypothetical protein RI949_705 [Pseudomonadota bacterium]|jgi:light-harvesting complex 1 beta chain
MSHTDHARVSRSSSEVPRGFMSIFLLAFGLLFVVAVLGRLVGLQWRDLLPGAENSDGISDGVKAAVYTFMSHLI